MSGVTRPPDRHPYELLLLLWSLVYGIAVLLDLLPTPASIRLGLTTPWMRLLWASLLGGGALTALLSIYWKRVPGVTNFTGLLIEQVGLSMVGAASIFYGAAVLKIQGNAGSFAGVLNIGFGVASFMQIWLIQKYVNRVHGLLLKQRVKEEAEREPGEGPT